MVTALPHGEPRACDAGGTLRVVVADDERPARQFLLALLRGAPDVDVVGEAADGVEAVAVIERTRPDLALLDLQMPELDGLGVVQTLERTIRRDGLPLVAFVTAHDAYAVRAFELHAVDYLLKPVDGPRLRRTLSRGALVRIAAIKRVEPMPGGTYLVTLASGVRVPVSRLRSRLVREQLLRL